MLSDRRQMQETLKWCFVFLDLKLICKYWPWSHPEIASIICNSPTGHPAGAQVGRGHVFQSCEQDPEALAAPVQFLTQVSEGFAGSLLWAVF